MPESPKTIESTSSALTASIATNVGADNARVGAHASKNISPVNAWMLEGFWLDDPTGVLATSLRLMLGPLAGSIKLAHDHSFEHLYRNSSNSKVSKEGDVSSVLREKTHDSGAAEEISEQIVRTAEKKNEKESYVVGNNGQEVGAPNTTEVPQQELHVPTASSETEVGDKVSHENSLSSTGGKPEAVEINPQLLETDTHEVMVRASTEKVYRYSVRREIGTGTIFKKQTISLIVAETNLEKVEGPLENAVANESNQNGGEEQKVESRRIVQAKRKKRLDELKRKTENYDSESDSNSSESDSNSDESSKSEEEGSSYSAYLSQRRVSNDSLGNNTAEPPLSPSASDDEKDDFEDSNLSRKRSRTTVSKSYRAGPPKLKFSEQLNPELPKLETFEGKDELSEGEHIYSELEHIYSELLVEELDEYASNNSSSSSLIKKFEKQADVLVERDQRQHSMDKLENEKTFVERKINSRLSSPSLGLTNGSWKSEPPSKRNNIASLKRSPSWPKFQPNSTNLRSNSEFYLDPLNTNQDETSSLDSLPLGPAAPFSLQALTESHMPPPPLRLNKPLPTTPPALMDKLSELEHKKECASAIYNLSNEWVNFLIENGYRNGYMVIFPAGESAHPILLELHDGSAYKNGKRIDVQKQVQERMADHGSGEARVFGNFNISEQNFRSLFFESGSPSEESLDDENALSVNELNARIQEILGDEKVLPADELKAQLQQMRDELDGVSPGPIKSKEPHEKLMSVNVWQNFDKYLEEEKDRKSEEKKRSPSRDFSFVKSWFPKSVSLSAISNAVNFDGWKKRSRGSESGQRSISERVGTLRPQRETDRNTLQNRVERIVTKTINVSKQSATYLKSTLLAIKVKDQSPPFSTKTRSTEVRESFILSSTDGQVQNSNERKTPPPIPPKNPNRSNGKNPDKNLSYSRHVRVEDEAYSGTGSEKGAPSRGSKRFSVNTTRTSDVYEKGVKTAAERAMSAFVEGLGVELKDEDISEFANNGAPAHMFAEHISECARDAEEGSLLQAYDDLEAKQFHDVTSACAHIDSLETDRVLLTFNYRNAFVTLKRKGSAGAGPSEGESPWIRCDTNEPARPRDTLMETWGGTSKIFVVASEKKRSTSTAGELVASADIRSSKTFTVIGENVCEGGSTENFVSQEAELIAEKGATPSTKPRAWDPALDAFLEGLPLKSTDDRSAIEGDGAAAVEGVTQLIRQLTGAESVVHKELTGTLAVYAYLDTLKTDRAIVVYGNPEKFVTLTRYSAGGSAASPGKLWTRHDAGFAVTTNQLFDENEIEPEHTAFSVIASPLPAAGLAPRI